MIMFLFILLIMKKHVGHESIIFGIRELNSTEFDMYCINTSSEYSYY